MSGELRFSDRFISILPPHTRKKNSRAEVADYREAEQERQEARKGWM
jgi:hypothetical protein